MHMRTVLVHHLVVQASEPLPERDDGERGHVDDLDQPAAAADSDADGKDMSDEDFDLPGDLLSSDEDLDEDELKRIKEQQEYERNLLKGKSLIDRKRLLFELEAQK